MAGKTRTAPASENVDRLIFLNKNTNFGALMKEVWAALAGEGEASTDAPQLLQWLPVI